MLTILRRFVLDESMEESFLVLCRAAQSVINISLCEDECRAVGGKST